MPENAKSPQPVSSRKRTPARVFSRRFIEPGEVRKALREREMRTSMKTKLMRLGTVMVGDRFIWDAAHIVGPFACLPSEIVESGLEGKELVVGGFMPVSYERRVLVRDANVSNETALLRLDMVKKALRVTRIGRIQ